MSRYLQFREQRQGLDAGARDKAVLIQHRPPTDVAESSGMPSDENQWTTLAAQEWMSRHDLAAVERFGPGQTTAAVDSVWVMTYRADMDPELLDVPKLRRLRYQSRTFDITGATLIGNKEGIELQTLARPSA